MAKIAKIARNRGNLGQIGIFQGLYTIEERLRVEGQGAGIVSFDPNVFVAKWYSGQVPPEDI